MSNAVYPSSFPGLAWSTFASPLWNTIIQKTQSLKEFRITTVQNPIWKFVLSYEMLRSDAVNYEYQTLVGFFNARQGAFDNFLYLNPDDNAVTNQTFAIGDGSTTAFQLIRSLGNGSEFVSNLNGTPTIYDTPPGGPTPVPVFPGNYSILNGIVSFNYTPGVDHTLAWSGGYYYRCRFAHDTAEFEQFFQNFWKAHKVELIGSLGLKI